MSENEVRELVRVFAEAAARQYTATEQGDFHTANRCATTICRAFSDLKALGKTGQDALLGLTVHTDPAVASLAACYSLPYAPDTCRLVLKRIARRRDIIGFMADETLNRWRDGTWALDSDLALPESKALPGISSGRASRTLPFVSLAEWLLHTPTRCADCEVEAFDRLGDRMGLASAYFGDIIGGLPHGMEWVPNSSPPSIEERLVWLWVVRPSMIGEILAYAHMHGLKGIIEHLGPEAATEES
jgi:hypothetical protein